VAALQALQEKVLPEDSEAVVKAVVDVLGRRAELSLPVLRCVGAIAQRGSDRALSLCLVKGNDRDPAVRLLAVEARPPAPSFCEARAGSFVKWSWLFALCDGSAVGLRVWPAANR
jgi:hypothetical protein